MLAKRAFVLVGLSTLGAACGGGGDGSGAPQSPAPATGTAELSWLPPTENTDGSALTDLAGYEIRYGRSQSDLAETISLSNPSLNTYLVEDLASGSWYFAVVAVNSQGVRSAPSNVASKTIP